MHVMQTRMGTHEYKNLAKTVLSACIHSTKYLCLIHKPNISTEAFHFCIIYFKLQNLVHVNALYRQANIVTHKSGQNFMGNYTMPVICTYLSGSVICWSSNLEIVAIQPSSIAKCDNDCACAYTYMHV